MQKPSWKKTYMALALAGVMLWAVPGFAQGRGGGSRGSANQATQDTWQGRGPGYQNCPNYPNYQNCPRAGGNTYQAPRGPRGFRGGRGQQPNTPSNPPVNQ